MASGLDRASFCSCLNLDVPAARGRELGGRGEGSDTAAAGGEHWGIPAPSPAASASAAVATAPERPTPPTVAVCTLPSRVMLAAGVPGSAEEEPLAPLDTATIAFCALPSRTMFAADTLGATAEEQGMLRGVVSTMPASLGLGDAGRWRARPRSDHPPQ